MLKISFNKSCSKKFDQAVILAQKVGGIYDGVRCVILMPDSQILKKLSLTGKTLNFPTHCQLKIMRWQKNQTTSATFKKPKGILSQNSLARSSRWFWFLKTDTDSQTIRSIIFRLASSTGFRSKSI